MLTFAPSNACSESRPALIRRQYIGFPGVPPTVPHAEQARRLSIAMDRAIDTAVGVQIDPESQVEQKERWDDCQ